MDNIYEPIPVEIVKVERHASDVKLFRIVKADREPFPVDKNGLVFTPGQFVLAGLWGYGEAPFGVSSDPYETSFVEIIVRKVGELTGALHTLRKGSSMTLRGPYGNGYPLKFFVGMDLLLVTGGCGIPPIASLSRYIIKNREKFGRVHLIYGAKRPDEVLLRRDLKKWGKTIDVITTVEKPEAGWKGRTGFVSDCLPSIKLDTANTAVIMCGPGAMVDAIEYLVNPVGISDRRIFISAERRMQCGVGRCQHCVTGEKYVCTDGPVFNLYQLEGNWD